MFFIFLSNWKLTHLGTTMNLCILRLYLVINYSINFIIFTHPNYNVIFIFIFTYLLNGKYIFNIK